MPRASPSMRSLHRQNQRHVAAQCRGVDAGGRRPAPSFERLRLADAGAGRRARVCPLRPARHRVPGHGRPDPMEKYRVRIQRDPGRSQFADSSWRPVDSHLRRHRQAIHRSYSTSGRGRSSGSSHGRISRPPLRSGLSQKWPIPRRSFSPLTASHNSFAPGRPCCGV